MDRRKMAMVTQRLRDRQGGVQYISKMRILLLGSRGTGKSSLRNTILGSKGSMSGRTAKCEKSEGNIPQRHITVVEVPGWSTEETPEPEHDQCDKIFPSLSLFGKEQGLHALLLVIRVDEPFTEEHRKSAQKHLELLSERVWSHTIALFTFGDRLGGRSIEQHIESEGAALQWVVDKCSNRYHVVDNEKSDDDQVKELLNRIEEVAENQGSVFGTPRKQAQSIDYPPIMSDSGFVAQDSASNQKTTSQSFTAKLNRFDRDISQVSDSEFVAQDSASNQETTSQSFTAKLNRFDRDISQAKLPLVSEDSIHIMKLIDEGGFGSVYRGSYRGTPVAVKKLHIGKCPPDSLEVAIPLRLSHPYIVKMMAVSRKEQHIFIVYEYINGANLHQITHPDPQCSIQLTEEEKLYAALEIGLAVEYIHGRNIIHQDIKPANILVCGRSKTAYLTDWGLANMKDSLVQFGATKSMCGPRGAGTLLYMPPELLLHNQRCTTMSDMWSLGVTYLEMFTGSMPWNLSHPFAVTGLLYKQEPPHALAKLQQHFTEIVEPLVQYEPQSRMNATDLVTCLKSKVDLEKKYGFKW